MISFQITHPLQFAILSLEPAVCCFDGVDALKQDTNPLFQAMTKLISCMQKKSKRTDRRSTKAIENLVALAGDEPIIHDAEAIAAIYRIDSCQDICQKSRSRKTRDAFWKRIERLKNIEKKCLTYRGRDWLYRFLNKIYKFRCSMEEWQEGALGWSFVKLHTSPQHYAAYDTFRILLDIASSADEKSRSRWAQALRYAHRNRKIWRSEKSLRQFLLENGGVSGCARQMAEPRKKKRIKTIRTWA